MPLVINSERFAKYIVAVRPGSYMAEEVLEERISCVLEENGEPFVSSNIAKIFPKLPRMLVKGWLAKRTLLCLVLRIRVLARVEFVCIIFSRIEKYLSCLILKISYMTCQSSTNQLKNINKKFKCHVKWTPCIWDATRKRVIIVRFILLSYTGVFRYLYTADIEWRRIFSRAIISIFYSAFADTGFTTENKRRRSRRCREARN